MNVKDYLKMKSASSRDHLNEVRSVFRNVKRVEYIVTDMLPPENGRILS